MTLPTEGRKQDLDPNYTQPRAVQIIMVAEGRSFEIIGTVVTSVK